MRSKRGRKAAHRAAQRLTERPGLLCGVSLSFLPSLLAYPGELQRFFTGENGCEHLRNGANCVMLTCEKRCEPMRTLGSPERRGEKTLNYPYSMANLEEITGKRQQVIRKVLNRYPETKEHRLEKPNRTVFYDEFILDFLLKHFEIERPTGNVVGESVIEPEAPANPQTIPPSGVDVSALTAAHNALVDELRGQISTLEKQLEQVRTEHAQEVAQLRLDLEAKEAERLHFIGENKRVLSLLAAEKQEKQALQLMLPPPKKTIKERIKALFIKESKPVIIETEKGAVINDDVEN